jgi:hypothetical protein
MISEPRAWAALQRSSDGRDYSGGAARRAKRRCRTPTATACRSLLAEIALGIAQEDGFVFEPEWDGLRALVLRR